MADGASSSATICDQIKPFPGSQGLSRQEIETFLDGRLVTNLQNPKFRSEFGTFALIGHRKTRPSSYKALKCHELCDQVRNANYTVDEDIMDEIKDYCRSCEMEESLNLESVSPEVIATIMTACRDRIESSREFARFKKKLQDKLNQRLRM